MIKPVLLFACGNPSRGDDALGPMLLQKVGESTLIDFEQVELLSDFQLQIEHAMDLRQRRLVLFADASASCKAPFEFSRLQPAYDPTYTSHAMSPASVLSVYQSVYKQPPPPAFLLGIKAEQFELGRDLSCDAQEHLRQAGDFTEELLCSPVLEHWLRYVPPEY